MNPDICPNHIHRSHFEEWIKGSGVSPEITSLNVWSIADPCEIDELLNRNTNNRWKHWEHGPGWAARGIDPKGWERTYEGAQFKPDNPVQRLENGQPKFKRDGSPDYQKYFSASDCESAPLFLDTGIADYWVGVLNDGTRRLLITEGAKKAGAALTAGEACISLPGVSNGQRKGRLKKDIQQFCTVGRTVVIAFDSDLFHNPNVCKALDKLGRLIAAAGAIVRVLMLPPDTKGIDDFIVAQGHEAFTKLVDAALTFEEWRNEHLVNRRRGQIVPKSFSPEQTEETTLFVPPAEDNYILKAQRCLYSENPWIASQGRLYQWVGTHYELAEEAAEKRRIAAWCASTSVMTTYDWEYKYATATHVNNIYEWMLISCGVPPSVVNPPGVNCLNGTLLISWKGNQPSWELKAHNPNVVYTYVSQFEFDPGADPANCDRLLSCLDPDQQDIFIKTLAASLDLQKIRNLRGRGIRALLCKGDGNNGKDSLREAVQTLYGVGVVNASVSDFYSFDTGRKFTLAKLEGARISWSSENSSFNQLDNLQSLKSAITGEPLDIERKNTQEYQISLATVFFFNINNAPNLQASLEAIQSRWAVLSFNKTFKANADPSKGEIEADPRFRYDPNFLSKEVVPALLNKMLAALPVIATESIDYGCTDDALKEIQQDTNHLWRFARETGLTYQAGGRVYISELWQRLRQWYLDNGTLVIQTDAKGKEKKEWYDQPRSCDKNVKAENQIHQRFAELFPKITKERDHSHGDKHGLFYLANICFGSPVDHQLDHQWITIKALQRAVDHHGSPISPTLLSALESIAKLSPDDFLLLNQFINTKEGKLVIHGDPRLSERVTADPTGDPTGDPLVIQNPPTRLDVENCSAHIERASASLGSNIFVQNGGINNDSSTKNFGNKQLKHQFKVGDKARMIRANYWGVPTDKDLTILRIHESTAHVSFDGCRAITGVDVPLDWLVPIAAEQPDEQPNET